MMEQQVTRRLAAILVADVAGYSGMMGTDEAGTIAALRQIWSETFIPAVAARHGRIVKMMGDGALVEFGSVVEAVECAVAIQRAMGERNSAAQTPVEFRIGINLGEIVIEGGDIFGDGVNVATRLEGQAPIGGILASDVVHTQVSGKVGVTFIDSGEIKLKNIDRPLRVWRWGGNETAPLSRPISNFIASLGDDKPSIAVLPFDNLSGDPEQGYFADGITEDIITDLSKVSGLFVIARTSSFAYKGQAPDIRKISRELGVRYVLEGSVRRAAGRIRINAQMIDATTGGHLWTERYDRDLEDIFAVQDEVTRTIGGALKVKLTADEQTRRMGRRKVNPEAYDLLIRASQNILQFRPEALIEGRAMLQRAIELDPSLAVAYARLSIIHSVEYANQWNDSGSDHLKEALDLASKAIESDENEPRAYDALAIALLWSRQLDEGERAAQRMIQLDPNYANGYVELGNARHYKGEHESAVELYKQARRLDPQFDLTLHFLGRALFALGRFHEAEATFKRRLALVPRSDMTRFYLASLYGHMGRHDEARQLWRELLEVKSNFSVEHLKRILPYHNPASFDWFVDGIRKAGIAFDN
jgi:adenylate cyclase